MVAREMLRPVCAALSAASLAFACSSSQPQAAANAADGFFRVDAQQVHLLAGKNGREKSFTVVGTINFEDDDLGELEVLCLVLAPKQILDRPCTEPASR